MTYSIFKPPHDFYWHPRKVWRQRSVNGNSLWRHTTNITPVPFGFYGESLIDALYWPAPLIERKPWAAEYYGRKWSEVRKK